MAPHRLALCHNFNLHNLSDEMLQRTPYLVSKLDRYPPIRWRENGFVGASAQDIEMSSRWKTR